MHFTGMWGIHDGTVPPIAGPDDFGVTDPNKSSQQDGWFYSTADYVTEKWG